MEKQMYLAAQYLAAAGISFVEPKKDDSHTNLGFDIHTKCMETRVLSPQVDLLALNYKTFALEWHSTEDKESLFLDDKTHQEIIDWLTVIAQKRLGKDYSYNLHYDLPYEIDNDYVFKLENADDLDRLCNLRLIAEYALGAFTENLGLATEIRIWPHHFDTGGYSALGNTGIDIGFGMAIPDTVCNEYYFYIVGYSNGKAIPTTDFGVLSLGTWKNNIFKGAILPAKKQEKSVVIRFLKEAIKAYKNSIS